MKRNRMLGWILGCLTILLALFLWRFAWQEKPAEAPAPSAGEPTIPEPEFDWGITLKAVDVTPTGLTIHCTHAGETAEEMPVTGPGFVGVEVWDGSGWKEAERVFTGEVMEFALAVNLIPNGTISWTYGWEWLYGALPDGTYRFAKDFSRVREEAGVREIDHQVYYALFTIEDGASRSAEEETASFTIRLPNEEDIGITLYGDALHLMGVENPQTVEACEMPVILSNWSGVRELFNNRVVYPAAEPVEPAAFVELRTPEFRILVEEHGQAVVEHGSGQYAFMLSEQEVESLCVTLRYDWEEPFTQNGELTVYPYNRHLAYVPHSDAASAWLRDHAAVQAGQYSLFCMDSAEDIDAFLAGLSEAGSVSTRYGEALSVSETLKYYGEVYGLFDVYRVFLVCMEDDVAVQHLVSTEAEDGVRRFLVHRTEPENAAGKRGIWICVYTVLREESSGDTSFEVIEGAPLSMRKLFGTKGENEAFCYDGLDDRYGYQIWLSGFSEVRVNVDGTVYELGQALRDGTVVMEEVLRQARMDAINGVCERADMNDGGTVVYTYESYRIVQRKTPEEMDGGTVLSWNRDVWITPPDEEVYRTWD